MPHTGAAERPPSPRPHRPRRRWRLDWDLLGCALGGHVLFDPDEQPLRRSLTTDGPDGPCWRCLRCATFVAGTAPRHGPAAQAPAVRRGPEMRDAVVLRLFAVERWLRAALFAVAAYVVARFADRQDAIRDAFQHAPPLAQGVFGAGGLDLQRSRTMHLLHEAVDASPTTVAWVIAALSLYALIEVVEGLGLWLLRRWGEYFAFIATGLFIPFEIYELTRGATPLKIAALLINTGLVVYLAVAKRLFGLRGGRRAYEAARRADSLLGAGDSAATVRSDRRTVR